MGQVKAAMQFDGEGSDPKRESLTLRVLCMGILCAQETSPSGKWGEQRIKHASNNTAVCRRLFCTSRSSHPQNTSAARNLDGA